MRALRVFVAQFAEIVANFRISRNIFLSCFINLYRKSVSFALFKNYGQFFPFVRIIIFNVIFDDLSTFYGIKLTRKEKGTNRLGL